MNLNTLKTNLKKINENYIKFINKYKRPFENFVLTYLYLFAINNLISQMSESILESKLIVTKIFAEIYSIVFLRTKLVNFFFSTSGSSKGFIFFYLIIQFVISKNIFSLSLLIRYNIVLTLLLELFHYAGVSFLDFFDPKNFTLYKEEFINSGKEAILGKGSDYLFIIFFLLYCFCYYKALKRKVPYIKNLILWNRVLDSISYWFEKRR